MEQVSALNVAIVGGGPGCKAIMDVMFAETLSQLRMKLIGVASRNPKAVGCLYAQKKGIYTTTDYRNLYKFKDLHMIIELTGSDTLEDEISRTKPPRVKLMDHVAARVFWDIFNVEEQRIAERRQAEEALRESEQEKDAILNSMSEDVVYHDMEHRIVWANSVASKSVGLTPDDLVGQHCYEMFHRRTKPCPGCPVLKARETGEPQAAEMTSPDGRTWFVRGYPVRHVNNVIAGVVEVTLEITKRKRAEEALRRSENLLRMLINATKEAIISIGQDGLITLFNPAAEKMFGLKEEEMIGQPLDLLMPEDVRDRHRQYLESYFATGKSKKAIGKIVELPGLRSNGKVFPMEISLSAGKHGDKKFVIAVARDITERKEVEEERKTLEAQLQHAQKMESVGTLAGGIAHDFNNLLMAVQGNVSLMLLDIDSTHPTYERLKNVEKQIQSGARLTSHLLGYARKGKYEVKPLDLNQLLKETSDAFGRTRKEVMIHWELSEDLSAIKADPGQIEQVLLNLYVNAADAMPGGGNLILKTMNMTHKDMKDKVYDPKPGKYVLLTVTDTGTGMDDETIARIFDPFFTTKEMGRGTGLGLASTYGIIKGHGGYIDVDSKKGQGSTFNIYLPVSEIKFEKAIEAAEQFIRGTGTVLVVDDEDEVLEIAKELLEAMGYRVISAKDGKGAVEVYKKNQGDINIVVLDMVMPNMGGGEAYDRMKEINPDIKVLLSSGFSIDGEATEIMERGCDGFIQKPFKMKDFSEKIMEILNKG